MMVLVVAASRHGSTAEIAEAIGARLRDHGHDVHVSDVSDISEVAEVSSPDGYDAVVIGSAVYAGSWLKDARDYARRNANVLTADRVWLFSSGPLDDPEMEVLASGKLDGLLSTTGALGHHVFAGRLDRAGLSRGERLLTRIVHAPDGDYRDWDDVSRWADEIADALA